MYTKTKIEQTEVETAFSSKRTIQTIFDITKSLDNKFESQISFFLLYFKKAVYESDYEEYFDWRCALNHHHVNLIPIIEVLNLVIEIFYLTYNRDQLTTSMILIFAILKIVAIFLEFMATLHHRCIIFDVVSDYFTYLGIAIGDRGISYMIIIGGLHKLDSLNNFLFLSAASQYFLVIYSRSKTYFKSMILFSLSFFFYTLTSSANMFLTKDYELVQLGGFIVLGLIFHIFIYYINKCNRRSFYNLFCIMQDLNYHQEMIDNLPLPLVISDKKSVIYLNKPSFKLFRINEKSEHFEKGIENLKVVFKNNENKDNQVLPLMKILLNTFSIQSFSSMTNFKILPIEKDVEIIKIFSRYKSKPCWVTCFRDITEIKKKANEDAIKKYELIVIGSMTHNFRTPLNSILGISDLILTSSISISELHIQYAIKIKNQSLILLDLVDNIHEYFNYRNNKLQREDALFDPKEVIQSICNLYEDDLKAKNIELSLKIKNESIHSIVNDKKKYRQIIISLILNSIKRLNNNKIQIKIYYKGESKTLVTQIRDQGTSIPQEIVNGLFQDSSRVDESSQHSLNEINLGYGFSLSQAFCTIMGGNKFNISSKENEGTKITFKIINYLNSNFSIGESSFNNDLFNFDDSERMLNPQNHQINFNQNENRSFDPPYHRKKILLVDDENSNIFILQRYAEKMNLSYNIAYNGKEAVNLYEQSLHENSQVNYKIIFMDVNMPIMDGIESTKQIRLLEKKRIDKVFIIGVTANLDTSKKQECLNAGMNMFKTKPFQYIDFKNIVSALK